MRRVGKDGSHGGVWRAPVALATVTLAGLLTALAGGEQPWRAIAWAMLSVPLVVGAVAYLGFFQTRRERSRPHPPCD